jgi:peptide/nickel transport system permease protein
LNQDFVHTLRAKGLKERTGAGHIIKNALPQILAVMGLQFGYLLGCSIGAQSGFCRSRTGQWRRAV